MAEADHLIAFWDGRSRGTLNTILTARDSGIPIQITGPDGAELPLLSALVIAEEAGVFDAWDRARTKAAPSARAGADPIWYLWDPGIVWYDVGDADGELYRGPIAEAGWYIHPICDPMCCRPEGPFATKAAALSHTRRQYFDLKYPVAPSPRRA